MIPAYRSGLGIESRRTHIPMSGRFSDPDYGGYPMHAPVPRMSKTPGRVRWLGPRLGAHNSEVLEALGLKAEDIEQLKSKGVI